MPWLKMVLPLEDIRRRGGTPIFTATMATTRHLVTRLERPTMFWAIRSHTTATDLGAACGGSQFSRQSPLKNSQAQAPEDFGRRLKFRPGHANFSGSHSSRRTLTLASHSPAAAQNGTRRKGRASGSTYTRPSSEREAARFEMFHSLRWASLPIFATI